ncbi:MAG: SIMPL domain-containing protein [Sandarakinorhabdus sp.]|nr:SIMPL domain-containing protein [Sandarakinorhabdus sp.]
MISYKHQRGVAAAVPLIAAMAMPSSASAQTVAAGPVPSTLSLTVEGRTTRTPDVAEVSGGVVTAAPTAAAAMAENAARMNAVVAAIRKAGIAERDIQTVGVSLQPQYKYENNQPPMLTGYQATNTVNLRIRKIADTGKLLDTLVNVGANQINGPNFRVEDSEAALDEARLAAVKTAKARAELYAKATGLRIRRIVTLSESAGFEPGPRPMMVMARMDKAEAAPTPVAPGEVALTINLTAVFEFE